MLSNYTIPRAVTLETLILYCRQNARFPMHTIPPRKFSECPAHFLICPLGSHTGTDDFPHGY